MIHECGHNIIHRHTKMAPAALTDGSSPSNCVWGDCWLTERGKELHYTQLKGKTRRKVGGEEGGVAERPGGGRERRPRVWWRRDGREGGKLYTHTYTHPHPPLPPPKLTARYNNIGLAHTFKETYNTHKFAKHNHASYFCRLGTVW